MTVLELEFTEQLLTRIRKRRQELGITQKGLANMIGRETSGHQWIHKIESGRSPNLTIQTVFLLMEALKIKIIFKDLQN